MENKRSRRAGVRTTPPAGPPATGAAAHTPPRVGRSTPDAARLHGRVNAAASEHRFPRPAVRAGRPVPATRAGAARRGLLRRAQGNRLPWAGDGAGLTRVA